MILRPVISLFAVPALLLAAALPCAAQSFDTGKVISDLWNEGFMNLRAAEDSSSLVITLENDTYKLQAEGFARALDIIELQTLPTNKPTEVVATKMGVPQVTMRYDPELGRWLTTSRVNDWDKVRRTRPVNSTFGKVDIVLYPQVSIMNLIINQVYQSLWQINPTLEVGLWRGAKFSYQIKVPLFNDGYGDGERIVHPSFLTLSQQFRDPWNLNVFGKLTVGTFSNSRFGAVVEAKYYFPDERFSVDTQFGLLGLYYWQDFILHYDRTLKFRWNVAGNFYWPEQKTQFTLRAQQFLLGEIGAKFEMIRHFRHCSIGFYAEKAYGAHTNGGFRFQIALPPYRFHRKGSLPRITTSGQMGLVYNANNEQYYYKEFKTEASDNIMEANSFNPCYIASELKALR